MAVDVAVFVGSLRNEGFSRKTAKALIEVAPSSLELEIVETRQIPLFNQDDDTDDRPQPWAELRQRVRAADAVLFVTPEYNRSIPGGLKNALDVGSRPSGQNSWAGKPGAIVSVSPGTIGGFGANHHLRQSLVFLNVPVMPQPEAYIGGAANLFDEQGNLTNANTREFLSKFMTAFAAWIETISKHMVGG